MEWHFTNETCITHKDGHTITLRSGFWHDPSLVIPKLNNVEDPKVGARIIQEGLYYAKISVLEGDSLENIQ